VEDSSAKDALVAQLQDTNNRQQATIHQGEQDMSELRLNMDALKRGNTQLHLAAAELEVEIHRREIERQRSGYSEDIDRAREENTRLRRDIDRLQRHIR
jgi:hypothetical protein